MNEENRKKREWVKSAAIVFLSIMLVLTFFSNTIMNYSLPEVATQMITSGTITAKIRGTGVVESGDPYNVEIKESRKVESVAVHVGDTVEIGDVLLYLEDEESAELVEAEKLLKTLQDDYDKTILTGLDAAMINRVESGKVSSTEEYLKKMNALKSAMDKAETEMETAQKLVNDAQAWINALELQISITVPANVDTSSQKKALNEAQTNLDNAEIRLDLAQAAYEKAAQVSGSDPAKLLEAENELAAAKTEKEKWETEVSKRQSDLNTVEMKAENAQIESERLINSLSAQLPNAKLDLNKANKELEEKTEKYNASKTAYEEYVALIPAELDLVSKLEAIEKQEEVVEKLRSQAIGATVTAGIAGTITSINVVAGETTTAGSAVAVIQPAGKGYTLSFSVTNEQAKRVSVGDPADLVNSWWYSDVQATVASIRPDTSNPTKNKLLTFNLTGELTAGQSLTLSVGQKSATYDMIVPNSAIREDNNGKFILIVEQKSSPLGNRFKATRVDVDVLAADETQSAITGAVYGWEDVITTSTKPVEAGQLIRLPD
ncbi:MAG: HlyD family efflux transporter periplasmic adaptor subunit [Lachnospiraceae bacterium]|nr:HlyD family efflux transporter periplasmic adaptor subunit [Lachnospiraceae bacterium]